MKVLFREATIILVNVVLLLAVSAVFAAVGVGIAVMLVNT